MSNRRPCSNPKCFQLNRLDSRFCARCGTRLAAAPIGISETVQGEPHWVFIVVFVGFFLMVFLPIMTAVGPVSFIIIPFVLIGLRKAAKLKRERRDQQLHWSDAAERWP